MALIRVDGRGGIHKNEDMKKGVCKHEDKRHRNKVTHSDAVKGRQDINDLIAAFPAKMSKFAIPIGRRKGRQPVETARCEERALS